MYTQPVFTAYSSDNPVVSPCPPCKCVTKRGTQCKNRTCKNKPCCWRHNKSVIQEVTRDQDNRLHVLRKWVIARWRRPRTHVNGHVVESVIERIYHRLERLLVHAGMNRAKPSANFKRLANTFCFLSGVIPSVMHSHHLRDVAIQHGLQALRTHMVDYNYVDEMICSADYLGWDSHDHDWKDQFHPTDLDFTFSDEDSYKDRLANLTNMFIQTRARMLTGYKPQVTEETIIQQYAHIVFDQKWKQDINVDLILTRYKKRRAQVYLSLDDCQTYMVYFVTHLVLVSNNWGVSAIHGLTTSQQNQLFKLMKRWFYNLYNASAVHTNLEVFGEICYCLLYLNIERRTHTLPPELWTFYHEYLQLATKHAFEKAPLATVRKDNIFFSDDPRLPAFHRDFHALYIMASFFAAGLQYELHRVPGEFTWSDTQKEDLSDIEILATTEPTLKNTLFTQLFDHGLVYVKNTSGCPFPNQEMQTILTEQKVQDILMSKEDIHKLVPAMAPPTETSLFQELQQLQPFKHSVEIRRRIAEGLGLSLKRILMFPDKSFMRYKKGTQGKTIPHADFYHFVTETDLLSHLRRHSNSTVSGSHVLCDICQLREGIAFKQGRYCRTCVSGYIPIFTAWISLGNYTCKDHSLLRFVPDSQRLDYSHINETKVLQRELPKGFRSPKTWSCEDMDTCDMVLFNCKTIHKATPGKKPRISMDIRFAILPA